MKRYIIILSILCMIFTGCTSKGSDKEIVNTVDSIVQETPTPTSTPTPTPTETPAPTPTPEPIMELSTLHFDVLDIDLPYLASFDSEDVHSWLDQVNGYAGFDDDNNNIHCEIGAYLLGDDISVLTDAPFEYNEYFFEGDTSVVKEWEDIDNVFTIHAQTEGFDTILCINRNDNCKVSYKLMVPSEDYSKYVSTIEYICETIKNIHPNPQVIDEETIVKECQKRYGSPLAEIDHYQDGKPVVHCYELVENEDESHYATWGWAVVDPVTGDAYDDITFETFTIPGAKVK